MRKLFISLIILLTMTLAGCMHFASNQQGNTVTKEMLAQLKPGMTVDQVVYILGNPILDAPYADNNLDYIYMYGNVDGDKKQHLEVFFKDGKYVTYRSNYNMSEKQIIADWEKENE